ncbi:MAG TPA: hypothetical protein VJ783_24015 [Pirellulales bacterium]|nr:hypothetical protein [Pirellulales bacterium]
MARTVHRNDGDAIAGERVIAQGRKIGKMIVVAGTSTHKMQEVVLRSNVLCVLDRPFRLSEEPFQLVRE